MQTHSEAAWKIASLYSGALASETRDLAAHIDIAIDRAAVPLAKLIEMFQAAGYDDTKAGAAALERFNPIQFFELYRTATTNASSAASP